MESPSALGGAAGAVVHYQLPSDGPLPQTFLVTLAVTDPHAPDWIVSNFARGVVRTVTVQNQGRFAEAWDGLDENGMPVPPGSYGVKGIFMPAQKWAIDGQYHTVIPKLTAQGGSWGQAPSQDTLPGKVEGDPTDSPLRDVDVAPGGMGAVTFQYLENGRNFFLTDFNLPIGYGQIVQGYESGEFAGALSTCTDGVNTWSFSDDGGTKFVGRADGKPFGHQRGGRDHVYVPEGWVTALAAWPEKSAGRTVIFDAERGRMIGGNHESASDHVDRVRALDSRDASVLGQWKVERPLGLAARNGRLYVLHGRGERFEVLTVSLGEGWERAKPALLFTVPAHVEPFDIEADSHGRVYLSDSGANHVFQFDPQGKLVRTFGRLNAQIEGHYDPQSFMAPEKLACWADAQGHDRLLVVEMAGPNRLSEWSGDTGELIRQWVVPQTRANDGYAVDSDHPDLIYLQGQGDTLVRWKIDYASGAWTPGAVWTHIGPSGFGNKLIQPLARPRVIHAGAGTYIAFGRGYVVYRLEGDQLRACAAVLQEREGSDHAASYLWCDRNGDGHVQESEYGSNLLRAPPGTFRYFGETWFDDLSLVCVGQGTPDMWKLTPVWDERGTPIFDGRNWRKLLTDEIFTAKQAGRATVLHGGNEVGENFNSDWAFPAADTNGSLYVSARSGPDFSANLGAQYKLSRYDAGADGALHQRWRVGRVALTGAARPGEVYGPMFVRPLSGLAAVIDNSRAGIVLYTQDGLYVDTVFPDDHLVSYDQMGAYWQPGEFFAGDVYSNRDNGKIYFAMGKTMPQLFEAQGWTTASSPVRSIQQLDSSVTLRANEIGTPSAPQLEIHGGASASRLARFEPATGGAPALDGAMQGWETCDPVNFSNGPDQSVEVRCRYDREHLYLRWHARTGRKVEPRALGRPENLFAHDRQADTLGLYLQCDPQAKPGAGATGGRPGDVRFVFALVRDHDTTKPVVLGMYPTWKGPNATPHSYQTAAGGTAAFAHVALVPDISSGAMIDSDGNGFVLAAAIPRSSLPDAPLLEDLHTVGNFDANFGGHDRFWWSNIDGSASRETQDEPTEARLYPGAWAPIQFASVGPMPIRSWLAIGPFGLPEIDRLDYDKDRDRIISRLTGASFPPDKSRDFRVTYQGPQTHTRAAQRKVTWQKVELTGETLDLAKTLGWAGGNDEGAAYLLTHIYSPTAAEVGIELTLPDGQSSIHGQLNGRALPVVSKPGEPWTRLDSSRLLHLQAGWNELLIRRDYIWGEQTIGATLKGDPAVLWQLRISAGP